MTYGEALCEIVNAVYGRNDKDGLLDIPDVDMLISVLDLLTVKASGSFPQYGYVSYRVVGHLIELYQNAGGIAEQLAEGCLGSGTWVLYSDDLPTVFIEERATSEWTSGHYIAESELTGDEVEELLDMFRPHELIAMLRDN